MKKFTAVVFVAALIAGIGTPAYAEPTERNDEEFRAGRLWHFAAMPAWFPVWSAIHEGSHALTATAFGYTGCIIHPYPHTYGETHNFGDFHCNEVPPKAGEALIFAAPSAADILIFTASDLLLGGTVNPDSLAGGLIFTGGMLAPWIDFTVNASNLSRFADNAALAKYAGIPRWTVIAVQEMIAAFGLWRLYSRFNEIFFDKPGEENVPIALGIVPSFGADTASLQLTGIF